MLYIDQLISHTKAFPSSKLVSAAARNPKGINRAAAASRALLGWVLDLFRGKGKGTSTSMSMGGLPNLRQGRRQGRPPGRRQSARANGLIGVAILKKSELFVSTKRQVGVSLSNRINVFFENSNSVYTESLLLAVVGRCITHNCYFR